MESHQEYLQISTTGVEPKGNWKQDPSQEVARWRVGRKVPLNVYEGNKPMFQCHTPEDAARVVFLLNRLNEIQPGL